MTEKEISDLTNGKKYTFNVSIIYNRGEEGQVDELSQYPMHALHDTPKILTDYISPNPPTSNPPASYGTSWEYIEFGDWPQSKKASSVGFEDDTDNAQLLLAETILDKKQYNAGSLNSKFDVSSIHTYLNDTFYTKAFSDKGKNNVLQTNVFNGSGSNRVSNEASSSGVFTCDNTNDYVFMLCQSEVVNSSYGFKSVIYQDVARNRGATDYYNALTSNPPIVKKQWWLRSPSIYDEKTARTVHNGYSYIKNNRFVEGHDFNKNTNEWAGVVPAICIPVNPAL